MLDKSSKTAIKKCILIDRHEWDEFPDEELNSKPDHDDNLQVVEHFTCLFFMLLDKELIELMLNMNKMIPEMQTRVAWSSIYEFIQF